MLASSILVGLSIVCTVLNFKNVALNFTLIDSYKGYWKRTWSSSSTCAGHVLHVLSSLGVFGEVYRPVSTRKSWLESLHLVMVTRLSSLKNWPYIASLYETSVNSLYLWWWVVVALVIFHSLSRLNIYAIIQIFIISDDVQIFAELKDATHDSFLLCQFFAVCVKSLLTYLDHWYAIASSKFGVYNRIRSTWLHL